MGMLAHNPEMAAAKGISVDVAEEFAHKPEGGYKKKKKGHHDYHAMVKKLHGK